MVTDLLDKVKELMGMSDTNLIERQTTLAAKISSGKADMKDEMECMIINDIRQAREEAKASA